MEHGGDELIIHGEVMDPRYQGTLRRVEQNLGALSPEDQPQVLAPAVPDTRFISSR